MRDCEDAKQCPHWVFSAGVDLPVLRTTPALPRLNGLGLSSLLLEQIIQKTKKSPNVVRSTKASVLKTGERGSSASTAPVPTGTPQQGAGHREAQLEPAPVPTQGSLHQTS